jgi:hypothetical protein
MKMEDHFKDTLHKAVASEPPALDAWDTFRQRVHRGRRVRMVASFAGAAALIVAAVIVLPKLGAEPGGVRPESPGSTAPTLDAYAGWNTYENPQWGLQLRYPSDWVNSPFEGVQEFHPGSLPGLEPGMPTFAVSVFLLGESYDAIDAGPGNYTNGTAGDGEAYLRVEQAGRQITYLVDWRGQCGAAPACTLRLILSAPQGDGSPAQVSAARGYWDRYVDQGERLVASVTKTPAPAGSASP